MAPRLALQSDHTWLLLWKSFNLRFLSSSGNPLVDSVRRMPKPDMKPDSSVLQLGYLSAAEPSDFVLLLYLGGGVFKLHFKNISFSFSLQCLFREFLFCFVLNV